MPDADEFGFPASPQVAPQTGISSRSQLRRLVKPFGIRDFALLWTGMTVSLIGDGLYTVALAWQVYELSNAPTALSLVGIAWSVPFAIFSLFGGVLSDRLNRRWLLIASDLLRGTAVACVGVLSVWGILELWHMILLAVLYGIGEGLFWPAFSAIVPDIVPPELLVEANSVDQFVRPLTFQFLGPALGGFLIAAAGTGSAFLVDAGTFGASAIVLTLMRSRSRHGEYQGTRSALAELAEGFRFIRSQTWLWGSLLAGTVSWFLFWGPFEVLLPFVVKNALAGGADGLGLVLAAGGIGALLGALAMGYRGLPRAHITFMYLTWALALLPLAAFGLADAVWQAAVASFVMGTAGSVSTIVWRTLIHVLIPSGILGRVTGIESIIALGFIPLSLAITGPIAELIGARETLVGAGLLSSIVIALFFFLPGMRDIERKPLRPLSLGKQG